jgi:hypothetical protein
MYYIVVTKSKINRHRIRKQSLETEKIKIGDHIMKTQNNNQETSKSQVSKLTFRVSVFLFSALLISFSVNAQEFLSQFTNSLSYGMTEVNLDGPHTETKNADAALDIINSELADQLYYSSESFNAIENEEALQVESWMTDETIFQNTKDVDFETPGSAELLLNSNETEDALEIESWMINSDYFLMAETILISEDADEAIEVESWMTKASYFMEESKLDTKGADQELAKHAEKIVKDVETEDRIAIEKWMLEPVNFTNQSHYDHLAVN